MLRFLCSARTIVPEFSKNDSFEEYELEKRLHQRGEQQELHFMYTDPGTALLPSRSYQRVTF